MSNIEEWYKEWTNKSHEIINESKEKNQYEVENLKLYILKNIDCYLHPINKRYAKNETKSVVDISFIYDKVIDGVHTVQFLNKKSKIKENDVIYEYGFNDNNECLYRKIKNKNEEKIDRFYVYQKSKIYELNVLKFRHDDINNLVVTLLGEYFFDQKNYPIKTIRHYGLLNYEEYNWISDSIAIVQCGIKEFILLKDQLSAAFVFEVVHPNQSNQLFSYNTQNTVILNKDKNIFNKKIEIDNECIHYFYLQDIKGKMTEYKVLAINSMHYLVSTIYMHVPKTFSYRSAKLIYKNEIFHFIKNQLKTIEFDAKFVNIEYFNYGYSIMNILIGFNDVYCDDIHSMKIVKDFSFSEKNNELISNMNDYINTKMYYQSYRKIMESLKKDIEKSLNIKVLLIEIND